jgi:hypothetical protein
MPPFSGIAGAPQETAERRENKKRDFPRSCVQKSLKA